MTLGVVLAGGQSRRMGRDKGLLPCEDSRYPEAKNWAQRAFLLLSGVLSKSVVSINPAQADFYQKYFSEETLVLDDRQWTPCEGPLRGLLSVHGAHPKHDLLVVAADMIHMEKEPLSLLLQKTTGGEHDLYLFESTHGLEPLCALYKAGWLAHVAAHPAQALEAGCSLRRLVQRYRPGVLEGYAHEECFNNQNYPL